MFFSLVLFIYYNYAATGLWVGDYFPDFEADTTDGNIKFSDWRNESWAILLSFPADYTPVATTELARAINLQKDFKKRDVKMIALSCDSVDNHNVWVKDIIQVSGTSTATVPIISDPKMEVAIQLGIIDPNEKDRPIYHKAIFVIGPTGRLMNSMWYSVTTGISFEELLRVIDSVQLTDTKKVATPVDWQRGEDCIVPQSIKEEEILKLFPKGIAVRLLPSGKKYLRWTPQPE